MLISPRPFSECSSSSSNLKLRGVITTSPLGRVCIFRGGCGVWLVWEAVDSGDDSTTPRLVKMDFLFRREVELVESTRLGGIHIIFAPSFSRLVPNSDLTSGGSEIAMWGPALAEHQLLSASFIWVFLVRTAIVVVRKNRSRERRFVVSCHMACCKVGRLCVMKVWNGFGQKRLTNSNQHALEELHECVSSLLCSIYIYVVLITGRCIMSVSAEDLTKRHILSVAVA